MIKESKIMEDRRENQRHPVFLELKQINGHPGNGTLMLNLSEGGAKLETSLAMSAGTALDICFVLPGLTSEIRRVGRVIWVMPAESSGRFLVGVQFLLIP